MGHMLDLFGFFLLICRHKVPKNGISSNEIFSFLSFLQFVFAVLLTAS